MSGGVAILGAGGFVGARVLEMAVLGGRTDIVPVVRAFRSVARVLRASARLFSTSVEYPGSVCSISGGMPHTPSGGGSMAPATLAFPPLKVSM